MDEDFKTKKKEYGDEFTDRFEGYKAYEQGTITEENLKTKKEEYVNEFIARSQGHLGIQQGEHKFPVNKKELKNWRIAYAASVILWFFLGGEIIGDNVWVVFYLISFIIPHIIMYHIIYKNYYFERIYGVKWSKEAEEYRLGKK